ncbi:MAG: hypothetical protein UU16_C0044G0011 [Candidatus Woesebacteria bacterium GW2011_GWA2_40_7]|uniref:PIN domain-containing protein n=1 Tax=Candidatus Woesebacteria bacterium GW2011_GWA2_40_7 TaxID=1618562 RepID=A0A0G0T5D8_9BACT|nr:MAG: hypothetical protein UU16_C0044G0011 [Candidatus Woesebacteria bacterium GW2011_GWA2_40_7]
MKYLVDSDFLISLYKPTDSNHKKASEIFKGIGKTARLVASNLVFQESTTVISKQIGMEAAIKFYDLITKLIDEQLILENILEKEAWKIFLKQTKKGTSFIDCANLAVCTKLKLDGILSFDEFYPKDKLVYSAYDLAVELNDLEHKSLYMRLAKNTPRGLMEASRSFVKDAANARSKGRLFMWKLAQLKAGKISTNDK